MTNPNLIVRNPTPRGVFLLLDCVNRIHSTGKTVLTRLSQCLQRATAPPCEPTVLTTLSVWQHPSVGFTHPTKAESYTVTSLPAPALISALARASPTRSWPSLSHELEWALYVVTWFLNSAAFFPTVMITLPTPQDLLHIAIILFVNDFCHSLVASSHSELTCLIQATQCLCERNQCELSSFKSKIMAFFKPPRLLCHGH